MRLKKDAMANTWQGKGVRAVLTADIVNSTRLVPAAEKKLLALLRRILAPHTFEFYRGDSFQVYIRDARAALQTALLCRTAAIGTVPFLANPVSDVRISIGIGTIQEHINSLGTARGEAFVLSGRAFDALTNAGDRLAMATTNAMANEAFQVMADYINAIFKTMTGKQAIVIFELLKGQTQQAVAAKLKKSPSTISQHVGAGRWPEIEKLMQQYKNIVNQLP